jgi:hypothetical protein
VQYHGSMEASRGLDLGARKTRICRHFALLAQLVEHFHGKEGVAGSSPAEGSENRATARFSSLRSGSTDPFRTVPSQKGSAMAAGRLCAEDGGTAKRVPLSAKVPRRYTPDASSSCEPGQPGLIRRRPSGVASCYGRSRRSGTRSGPAGAVVFSAVAHGRLSPTVVAPLRGIVSISSAVSASGSLLWRRAASVSHSRACRWVRPGRRVARSAARTWLDDDRSRGSPAMARRWLARCGAARGPIALGSGWPTTRSSLTVSASCSRRRTA